MSDDLEKVQKMIIEECDLIKEMLISKNKSYGNSAIFPKRLFSNQNGSEQIKVRIDDKISRINNLKNSSGTKEDNEDAVKDLIGYLILLRIAERLEVTN